MKFKDKSKVQRWRGFIRSKVWNQIQGLESRPRRADGTHAYVRSTACHTAAMVVSARGSYFIRPLFHRKLKGSVCVRITQQFYCTTIGKQYHTWLTVYSPQPRTSHTKLLLVYRNIVDKKCLKKRLCQNASVSLSFKNMSNKYLKIKYRNYQNWTKLFKMM